MTFEKEQEREALDTSGRNPADLEICVFQLHPATSRVGSPADSFPASVAILMPRTLPDTCSVVQTEVCRACEWVWANDSKFCMNGKARASGESLYAALPGY